MSEGPRREPRAFVRLERFGRLHAADDLVFLRIGDERLLRHLALEEVRAADPVALGRMRRRHETAPAHRIAHEAAPQGWRMHEALERAFAREPVDLAVHPVLERVIERAEPRGID